MDKEDGSREENVAKRTFEEAFSSGQLQESGVQGIAAEELFQSHRWFPEFPKVEGMQPTTNLNVLFPSAPGIDFVQTMPENDDVTFHQIKGYGGKKATRKYRKAIGRYSRDAQVAAEFLCQTDEDGASNLGKLIKEHQDSGKPFPPAYRSIVTSLEGDSEEQRTKARARLRRLITTHIRYPIPKDRYKDVIALIKREEPGLLPHIIEAPYSTSELRTTTQKAMQGLRKKVKKHHPSPEKTKTPTTKNPWERHL